MITLRNSIWFADDAEGSGGVREVDRRLDSHRCGAEDGFFGGPCPDDG